MSNNTSNVALITGAARRIGAEIARILHQNGMNIALHYHRSEKEAEALCAAFNRERVNSAMILQANLADISNFNQSVESVVQHWGRLDVLVNNASRFYRTLTGKATETDWDDLMASNLKAPFFLSQVAAPHLAKQSGCIVNIADIHAERPMRDYSVYCISKAGLMMLTKTLAHELAPGVRVNAVSPGAIAWPEGDNTLSSEMKEKIVQRTALKQAGHPRDIAKAVLYFVRDADYMTGQVIAVDGGRTLFI